MPTLFRLFTLIGVVVLCCWGVATAMVTYLTPTQREIEQVVALPPSINLTTGRSAAERLTGAAALLGAKRKHRM